MSCCGIYIYIYIYKIIMMLYGFIWAEVEKHLLPSFAIVQLDGVQTLFGWKSIQTLHNVKMKSLP